MTPRGAVVAVILFLGGLTIGLTRRPAKEAGDFARLNYAIGLTREEAVRLDRRLLKLEQTEPFNDFRFNAMASTVNGNANITNALIGAVRELYERMGRSAPL